MSDENPPSILPIPTFTPVPRAKDRSNGWKPQVQRAFIEALADSGSVEAACRRVGRSSNGAYQLRRQPGAEEFAAAWEAALAHGIRRIEDVAMDRAINGVEVPVYSYGKLVGTRISYNDRLLMFLLRNRAPDRFAEGRARALNAIDRMELARLRTKWRKEWEAQWAAEQLERERATMESINAKIDMMREREERLESPRVRAAREALEEAIAADRAEGRRWFEDPDHPLHEHMDSGLEDEDDFQGPPPGWGRKPEEPEPWDGVHRLKDEGWD